MKKLILDGIKNWAITSFIPTKEESYLDDLNDLLINSQKFKEA